MEIILKCSWITIAMLIFKLDIRTKEKTERINKKENSQRRGKIHHHILQFEAL